MDPDQQIRNLRDFLMVYNRMTEICFQRCSSNFNYRSLTMDEEHCVDNCAGKLIRSNHRLMGTYVQLMPRMVQRRVDEMESKAAAAEAAAVAAAGAAAEEGGSVTPVTPVTPEGLPAAEAPAAPFPPSEAPAFVSPAVTAPVQTYDLSGRTADMDLASTALPAAIGEAAMSEVASSLFESAGLDFSSEASPGPALSLSVPEERARPAAAPAAKPSALIDAVNGLAFAVAPPLELPPVVSEPPAGVRVVESGRSAPPSLEALATLAPARSATLSEEPTVSPTAAPTLSTLSQAAERRVDAEGAPRV